MDDDLPQSRERPDGQEPAADAPEQAIDSPDARRRALRIVRGIVDDVCRSLERQQEPEWSLDDVGEPLRVETGIPGVEKLVCDRCVFVYVDRLQYGTDKKLEGAKLMAALEPVTSEPGLKVIVVDGARMTPDEFFAVCPPGSEAVDGFAAGDSAIKMHDGRVVAEVIDHHGAQRLKYHSASWQVYQAVVSRLRLCGVQDTGRNMFFGRYADLDERLAVFARMYERELRDGRGRRNAERMYHTEDIIDSRAGSTDEVTLDDFATLNWIAAPLQVPADADLETKARLMFQCMRETSRRAQLYIRGEGGRIEVSTNYEALRTHQGWATVTQPENESAARWQMLQDGYKAALVLKPRAADAKPKDPHEYSVQKIDARSGFPLNPDFYSFLNFLHALPAEHTADEDAVRSFLSRLGRGRAFHDKGPFGGSDIVGGGKSAVAWPVLDAGIQWYLDQHGRTPDIGGEGREVICRAEVRSGIKRLMTRAPLRERAA